MLFDVARDGRVLEQTGERESHPVGFVLRTQFGEFGVLLGFFEFLELEQVPVVEQLAFLFLGEFRDRLGGPGQGVRGLGAFPADVLDVLLELGDPGALVAERGHHPVEKVHDPTWLTQHLAAVQDKGFDLVDPQRHVLGLGAVVVVETSRHVGSLGPWRVLDLPAR